MVKATEELQQGCTALYGRGHSVGMIYLGVHWSGAELTHVMGKEEWKYLIIEEGGRGAGQAQSWRQGGGLGPSV